jgi:asparagine synthase (glutamine-hydrolysing)
VGGRIVNRRQYWDLAEKNSGSNAPPTEEEVHSLIDESVRMQLVSDVPVGVFLSGGIDSSALAGILVRSGIKPSTFSIVFREADYSEAEYSRAVAQHFETDHHEITVSQQDVLELIPAALQAMDQPTMEGVNTFFVSQKTREAGLKIALSGLGGDEIFAGYSSFRTVPRMERFAEGWRHLPGIVRKSLADTYQPSCRQATRPESWPSPRQWTIDPSILLSRMLFTTDQCDQLLARNQSVTSERLAVPLAAL